MTTRHKLYALGETLGESATRRKLGGGYVCGGGGGGSSSSSTASTTNNTDNRLAVQDGVGVSGSSGVTINSTDAVKAIAQLGTDTIKNTGEAVVQLNQSSVAANAVAWDKTVTAGAALVDKLIDASTTLGTTAIDKFQPAENKASDTSLKLGMIAAAGVAATIILGRMK